MPRLTSGERLEAKATVQKQLEDLIAETPNGLTFEDLQEVWVNALDYWDIKRES